MSNLETKRTRLRRFALNDLENMIELESDADIMKFTPFCSLFRQSVEPVDSVDSTAQPSVSLGYGSKSKSKLKPSLRKMFQ